MNVQPTLHYLYLTSLLTYGIINTSNEGRKYYVRIFFDADWNYVGMFTEEAKEATTIFDVLIDAGYYVRKVNRLGDVDSDYLDEDEDEES